jgi:hypothetical protein
VADRTQITGIWTARMATRLIGTSMQIGDYLSFQGPGDQAEWLR